MIYIVTVNAAYYPLSGADDWELVTRDLESAKLRACAENGKRWQDAHLIEINEDNLHVHEIPFA